MTITEKQLNILVVDDEAGTRKALEAVLKLAGHQTAFAADGDEALEVFESALDPFDLIITDHLMVRVSGLDLVRQLRERGFAGDIMVLTAYAGKIEEQEYRKLEVAGIMGKPFHIDEMRMLLNCISKSREEARALGKIKGPPSSISFCWLKHD
jgi:two-component system response regulator PhoP